MVDASNRAMVKTKAQRLTFGASILLRLYGCLYAAFGLLCIVFPFVLRARPGDHVVRSAVIGVLAAVIGAAVIYGSRWAAVVFSVCSAALGWLEVRWILSSSSPSPVPLIIGYAVFALLPAVLTCLAWKSLR